MIFTCFYYKKKEFLQLYLQNYFILILFTNELISLQTLFIKIFSIQFYQENNFYNFNSQKTLILFSFKKYLKPLFIKITFFSF